MSFAMLIYGLLSRLVNVFVEPSHKKSGRSISELAAAIGLPRVLIDIRHESSHRDLPSLQLVRLASVKALDWLKSNYWEPQKKVIPDVQKEIRCRLQEMIYYLKDKHTQRMKAKRAKRSHQLKACGKLSSQVTGKLFSSKAIDFKKRISKISICVCRLYSAYPLDVVSVLMEFFQLHVSDFTDEEVLEDSDISHESPINSMSFLKMIITKLSHYRPGLLLSMLKAVLEMIKDIHEKGQDHFLSPSSEAKVCQIKRLCSFVSWLATNLKALKDSGRIGLMEKLKPLAGRDAVQKVSFKKLLQLCLSLSAVGDKHLSEAALLLSDLSGNSNLTESLRKLPLPCLQDQDAAEYSYSNIESVLLHEEIAIKKATEKLQHPKLQSWISNVKNTGTKDEDNGAAKSSWVLAKSWIPCPIGMLPCSFSSTSVLPALDKVDGDYQSTIISENNVCNTFERDHTPRQHHKADNQPPEIENAVKRLRITTEERFYSVDVINPMEGRLLIDGFWKKVDKEEIFAIQSKIKTFVQ